MLRALLTVMFALLHAASAVAASRPNVVVILADDLGWGDLSCYPNGAAWGDEACVPTPNLDALAASGVRCTQGYASSMVCAPSRAGLLSGQNQQRWGFYGFEDTIAPIPQHIKLLPQAMRQAGYRTGMFGKWHVSTAPDSLPLVRGFDRLFGFLGGQHDYFDASLGQTFHGVGWARDAHVFDQDQPVQKVKYLTEEFTDRAIDFMADARQEGKPFFVYLPYSAPHPPHQAPWEDLGPYVQRRPDEKFVPRDAARAMIVNLDRNVGRLIQWLRDKGLENDTLIFFSSDNGGSDGGPGRMLQHNGGLRGRKSTYYEGGVRVPFIVRWPAKLSAGVTYDKPVSQLDIYATALAAADADQVDTQPLDGVDLVPYLTGQKSDAPHARLYWSLERPTRYAVRDGDWKLVLEDIEPETLGKSSAGRPRVMKLQLFDLASDPFEAKDLTAERPELVQKLQALYDEFRAQCPPSLYTPEIEAKHKAELARRRDDPATRDDHRTAYGGPGHWFGGGAKERFEREARDAEPTTRSSAIRIHTIDSEYQHGPSEVHVLVPDKLEPDKRYPVLYVLPVYASSKAAEKAIAQAQAEDLANRFGLICVTPSFDVIPWYADHATDPKQRQESHILHAVLPFVEKTYPTIAEPRGRLLVGYSKSGWGAFSLLLRHPDVFGRAAAFDAPLMMGRGGRFSVPEQMLPADHFASFCVADLVEQRADALRGQSPRLAIFGQGIFNDDHLAFHARLMQLSIPHVWDNDVARKHAWDSGWLTPAVETLLLESR